jgi:hypothetical protein
MKTTPITCKEELFENLTIFNKKTSIYRTIKNVYGDHAITYSIDENDEDNVIFIGDLINDWVIAKEHNIYKNLEKKIQYLQEVLEKYEEFLPENILMFNENLNEMLEKIEENKLK